MKPARKFEFKEAVESLLHQMGAVEVVPGYLTLLHTIAGPVHCTVFTAIGPPFVAMYFEYAALARERVGSSAFCGKWNFHPRQADGTAVKQLEDRLRAIMIGQEKVKHENT